QLIVIGSAGLRLYKSVEIYYILIKENYKLIAFKAVSQTLKIFGGVILFFIAIKIVFKINSGTILGSLGAITAVMVLVFRDTILGFVTGIHVATSKNLKVGDWIGIPKYNIEGNITDISLLTTKIVNFDKTVSTIPTYDLMSTEIRNYQVMTEGNLRRIKRSMIFNIKSFRFLTKEDYEKLEKVNLISDYIITKKNEIESEKLELHNADNMLNGQQLTNIGVFRKYAENYLRNNPNIEQKEIILVRQLEITPQGMPLEIYCFTIYSNLEDYERVQSDIFDHLLVATQDFGLEVIQVNKV
ncbi:TPA: mechanosensitive ion channel family protein, partial [Elizabethkingia anophelis]